MFQSYQIENHMNEQLSTTASSFAYLSKYETQFSIFNKRNVLLRKTLTQNIIKRIKRKLLLSVTRPSFITFILTIDTVILIT